MQVTFNSQERTLREMADLAASSGWKVTKVTRTPGSLFGYIVAVPVPIPAVRALSDDSDVCDDKNGGIEPVHQLYRDDFDAIERASSRCGTPTFGSNLRLSSVQEALARFGGGIFRRSRITRIVTGSDSAACKEPPPVPLKPALTLTLGSGGNAKKKPKPSSLSVFTVQGSPTSPGSSLLTPLSATTPTSRRRRMSSTSPKQDSSQMPASGLHPHNLQVPSFIPVRTGGITSSGSLAPPHSPSTAQKTIPRRSSFLQLPLPSLRKRSGTVGGTSSSRPSPGLVVIPQECNKRMNDDHYHLERQLELQPPRSLARESPIDYMPEFGSGNVLAAAARFEKGK